jgi:hypothetical protein
MGVTGSTCYYFICIFSSPILLKKNNDEKLKKQKQSEVLKQTHPAVLESEWFTHYMPAPPGK